MKPAGECANPKKTAWTKSEVNSLITKSFVEKAGKDATDDIIRIQAQLKF